MFCSESNGSQGWLPLQVKTPRRFHRLTHDRNKIWYYTYLREQY